MPRHAPAPGSSQLSLFGDGAPAALPPAPRPAPPAGPLPAASVTAPVAAAPLAPASLAFRHPQAQREIRLHDHLVGYALRRARRRSIGFVVGLDGLSVAAPKWVGIGEIESALHDKADWILRKLGEQQERQQRLQAAKVDWRDGVSILYLGENLRIALDTRPTALKGSAVFTPADATVAEHAPTLHLGLPATATPEQIRAAVQTWLQRQARRIFEERCRHFAPLLGVRYTQLSLSSAQTRWGSASANGRIRLNWRLIHFAMPSVDYVVVHELSHLREMNHSPRFWAVVRSVMPDYEQARGTLKDDVIPVFD